MTDYNKIIKYLEKSEKLISKELESRVVVPKNLDIMHAKINLQFAIMDLKALQYEQDQEANEMGREYLKEMFGNDPIEDLDKLTIRGDK